MIVNMIIEYAQAIHAGKIFNVIIFQELIIDIFSSLGIMEHV